MATICASVPVVARPLDDDTNNIPQTYDIHAEYTEFDPRRKTVVFLHGYLGTMEDFQPAFLKYDGLYNMISVDLRGHGESGFPEGTGWTIKDFAYDIYQVLSKLLPVDTKVTLVASSLSTGISLQMARDFPYLIESMVLFSPSYDVDLPYYAKIIELISKLSPSKITKLLIDMFSSLVVSILGGYER